MATQEERRTQTRDALLAAGATLFAARGVAGASVDAIAHQAGRTSGALYDHFGSKEGLLFALLESWVDDATQAITADQAAATTLEEWVAAMWHAVARPPSGDDRWIALEHELWSYAAQSDEARRYLARRYRAAWDGVDAVAATWTGPAPDTPDVRVGPAVIGLLLGLEMMRRIDPSAVSDETAIAALRGVLVGASDRAATR
ncbi:TetR/AcrR family transcriptional regulator [Iamia sp.]|uniref:TetR/AcrR family transcriptional regulator n=1 Tax=Iamia sp. TaxID=2722710 RepID=UPI002B88CD0B|nr:TetR/AcrR family transcriptional regulator [Iamia sp.]HXH59497.1 TetR/AcrR family transcriptional regulator [Iamia sp.]